MEVSAFSSMERTMWIGSFVEALAVETILAAGKSLACLLIVTESLLNDINLLVSPKLTRMDERFPLDEILRRKHAYLKCKDASDDDDDDEEDEDDEDGNDQDDEGGDEDFSGEEGEEEGDPEDDPEVNGAGGSDDGDEDEEDDEDDDDDEDGDEEEEDEEEDEDEDEEEVPQPPAKKRK